MPRTPPFIEIPRRRTLILHEDDDDVDGDSGGGAGEDGAGGIRRVEEERVHDLGRNLLEPSSSSHPVAAAGSPEIILLDDDEEDEAEVGVHGEVQPAGGQGGGLVKEETPSDDGVDWDALEQELSSSDEDPGVSPGSKVNGGPASSSRGVGMDRQEGAYEDGEEERGEEVEPDQDGAEEEQDKDEDEWEVEEEDQEEEDDEEEEMEEDLPEAESDAEEEPHRRVPSNARAAGRYAGEIFPKRKFEGWYIARIADTTTAAESGDTIAARTRARRSRLRCLRRKLLRRGTCTYPYRVHTASSESSRDSKEDDVPPRPPAVSSGEEREVGGGGASYRRTVTGKKRRRGKKTAHGDDDSESAGYGGGQGVAAKRRGKRPMDPNATHGHGDDDESEEEDRPFPCSRGPKRGSAFCAAKNKGVPADGFDQHQQGDVIFKKSAFVFPRGRCHRDRETYDDLLDSIFEGIEKYQNGSAPADASVPPDEQGQGCDTLPLIFSFGDEDEVVKEKTDQENLEEELFADWDSFLLEQKSTDAPAAHTWEKDEKSNAHAIPADGATSCRCKPGKHVLFVDDEIGIRCKNCDYIEMEIRDIFPSMMKDSTAREPAVDPEWDLLFGDILKSIGYDGASNVGGHKTGVVWDLIPGVREDMFPHQLEAFEFMWKRLAGGIDIEELRHSMNTDSTSGCVISHAPGTGKTRLAITFVQSYLEIFPHCRPVIIAPRGMLATWEQEFRKWKVKLPFHVLSSSDIQWNEDKTIKKLIAQDENLGHKLSMKKLSQKSTLMVKLASWYEGSSIIGLSYSLYRNLAKGEGTDGETVRNLLLEKPGLLVLDEGHTPRNKKSLIWKVLAEVSTEKRIILSGTPFQNNFLELYNILCLVKPKFARDFACTRLSKKGSGSNKRTNQSRAAPHVEEDEGKEFWTSLRISNITDEHICEIREKLDPFVHIHNGDILQKSLPGLMESVVILNPLPNQKEIIAMMEKSAGKGFLDAEYKISLASIHPFLVTGTKLSDEEASVVEKMQSVRLNPCEGVKTWFVVEVVGLCEALNERVLVFSQYLEPLALIMDQLTRTFKWTEGKEILLMSGNVRVKQREALMEAFNDMNSEAKVMLASTKACCEGITLVGASRVVLLDVVWNPSVGRQAIGRAYRIGQEKIVYTYNLIAEGTKEKDKYDRQATKDHMSKLLFSNEPQHAGSNQSEEMISKDLVLEKMTAREDLKDMFVQIPPQH